MKGGLGRFGLRGSLRSLCYLECYWEDFVGRQNLPVSVRYIAIITHFLLLYVHKYDVFR